MLAECEVLFLSFFKLYLLMHILMDIKRYLKTSCNYADSDKREGGVLFILQKQVCYVLRKLIQVIYQHYISLQRVNTYRTKSDPYLNSISFKGYLKKCLINSRFFFYLQMAWSFNLFPEFLITRQTSMECFIYCSLMLKIH